MGSALKVVIRGAGDLASGVAVVLHMAGCRVVMTDLPRPTVIRRTVAFAQALFEGSWEVEGIRAVSAAAEDVDRVLAAGMIPVLADPEGRIIRSWEPDAVVDAILAKRNLGTAKDDAPVVIGLGPGFTAGQDVHAVIETMRGHHLGRIILEGSALPNTGTPGEIGGRSDVRVLRAPEDGVFRERAAIGDEVVAGQVLAMVGDLPVTAPFDGVLRGLLHDGLPVVKGFKVGDVDPRPFREHCFTVSDKARSLGGAVLCALLYLRRSE